MGLGDWRLAGVAMASIEIFTWYICFWSSCFRGRAPVSKFFLLWAKLR